MALILVDKIGVYIVGHRNSDNMSVLIWEMVPVSKS